MRSDLPDSAYQFKASAINVHGAATAEQKNGPRKCAGECYSGDVVFHPFWGQVIFDLSTTKAPSRTPLLINHNRDKRAGHAALSIDQSITIADGTLLSNEHGQEVANDSDEGFPWQMSVHIEPGSVEEIKAGVETTVNGRSVSGPASIWRNNLIREVSFTPTGVDSNTSALAMSAGAGHTINQTTEDQAMDLKELEAKVDELSAQLSAATTRANTAEAALEEQRKGARLSAVKSLFEATGRQFSDEAAKPYLDMDDTMFAVVSSDLRATVSQGGHLFSEHATSGASGDKGNTFSLSPEAIYSNLNRKGK